jgi:hypothetical protein
MDGANVVLLILPPILNPEVGFSTFCNHIVIYRVAKASQGLVPLPFLISCNTFMVYSVANRVQRYNRGFHILIKNLKYFFLIIFNTSI